MTGLDCSPDRYHRVVRPALTGEPTTGEEGGMRGATVVMAIVMSSVCAKAQQPGGQPPAPQTVYIHAPFDAVWGATVEAFANNRLPISTIDKASGLLVSKDF